ncbi:hypothetical protein RI129_011218 [Pyrocoelia pectoralis]|uniref:Cilia-and flagella-associated protein 96 n=1 Tax=Pyrocoelia pectoralis TaxID=417401 RepID=A0AAN7V3M1_9COLE
MGEKFSVATYATKFIKHDMERIGLFAEMPYMNGKGYVSPFAKLRAFKGRGLFSGGPKTKCGTSDGYFDDEFRRIFTGPGGGLPFVPPGCTKSNACPGDFFGTFAGRVDAFSRVTRRQPKRVREPPNCLTNPAKKGGPGYVGICLSKYPLHIKDPYRFKLKPKEYGKNLAGPIVLGHYTNDYFELNPYFEEKKGRVYICPKEKPHTIIGDGKWIPTGPAKWQGGCHAGTFSRYPEHLTDRNKAREAKERAARRSKKGDLGPGFLPQSMALKGLYTCSVLTRNTDLRVNATNFKVYESQYTKRLLASLF